MLVVAHGTLATSAWQSTFIHGTQVYGGASWTTSAWWLALVHVTLVLAYFSIAINTLLWDLGLWLYLFTTSVAGDALLRVVECWDPP